MKAIKQLLRQPIKAVAGILLVVIAVAVLCVCAGQSIAARETEERLNQSFLTLAFPKSNISMQDQIQWAENYAVEHPEIVETISSAGLASAYVPELTIDNWSRYWHKDLFLTGYEFTPYDTAILEIILTEIGDPQTYAYAKGVGGIYMADENGELIRYDHPSDYVTVELEGRVERAVALEAGYPDPTGFTARIDLDRISREDLDALDLEVGQRYLVYGTGYQDLDWELRHSVTHIMTWNKNSELPEWDLDTFEGIYDYHSYEQDGITYYSYWTRNEEGQLEEVITVDNLKDVPLIGFKCKIGDLYHGMTLSELNQFRSISMVCGDDGTRPKYDIDQNEDGIWICQEVEERSYLNEDGEKVYISREEYAQRYREPVMVRLTGTAKEFLAGEDGALWREAMNNVQVNNHAFAFIGVDNLNYIENFDRGEARIVQGRDFTNEELRNGVKVCVISKQLAEASGLTVGDIIHPQFYAPDMSLAYQNSGSLNIFDPKPSYYFSDTTQLRENQSYTIVGIYLQNNPTPNFFLSYSKDYNPYGFTCNTIFAPKNAIDAVKLNSNPWAYKTVVLHNGALEDFQLAAIEAGLGEEFQYTDNGYSAVEGSLATYQENAARALAVGMTVYGILLLLFLVLFPTRERAVLLTMEALGAERPRRIGYLLSSSLGLLIPGTILGVGGGMLLWDKVAATLSENGAAMLDIRMNAGSMTAVAVVQLVAALELVLLLAVHATKNKNLFQRK